MKAVKYLYKYIYKWHEKVVYIVQDDGDNIIDEIKQFQDGYLLKRLYGKNFSLS